MKPSELQLFINTFCKIVQDFEDSHKIPEYVTQEFDKVFSDFIYDKLKRKMLYLIQNNQPTLAQFVIKWMKLHLRYTYFSGLIDLLSEHDADEFICPSPRSEMWATVTGMTMNRFQPPPKYIKRDDEADEESFQQVLDTCSLPWLIERVFNDNLKHFNK